jgi:hypothetical protein
MTGSLKPFSSATPSAAPSARTTSARESPLCQSTSWTISAAGSAARSATMKSAMYRCQFASLIVAFVRGSRALVR